MSGADRARHIDNVARTIWGESRGEPRRGQEAVAAVIMNRVRDPRRWPHNPTGVVHQPWQFSPWNPTDPNRRRLLAVTTADAAFRQAMEIATLAVDGRLADPTQGANHFYAWRVIRSPSWADPRRRTVTIGGHRFLRL